MNTIQEFLHFDLVAIFWVVSVYASLYLLGKMDDYFFPEKTTPIQLRKEILRLASAVWSRALKESIEAHAFEDCFSENPVELYLFLKAASFERPTRQELQSFNYLCARGIEWRLKFHSKAPIFSMERTAPNEPTQQAMFIQAYKK